MQPSAKALQVFPVTEFWEALGETLCRAYVQFCFLIFQKNFLEQGGKGCWDDEVLWNEHTEELSFGQLIKAVPEGFACAPLEVRGSSPG